MNPDNLPSAWGDFDKDPHAYVMNAFGPAINAAAKHYGLQPADVRELTARTVDTLIMCRDVLRINVWALANDIDMETGHRVRTGQPCSCGSDEINYTIHADWCPAIGRPSYAGHTK